MVVRISPVERAVRLNLDACVEADWVVIIKLALHGASPGHRRLPYALARNRCCACRDKPGGHDCCSQKRKNPRVEHMLLLPAALDSSSTLYSSGGRVVGEVSDASRSPEALLYRADKP